jgi:hypothetical protein
MQLAGMLDMHHLLLTLWLLKTTFTRRHLAAAAVTRPFCASSGWCSYPYRQPPPCRCWKAEDKGPG